MILRTFRGMDVIVLCAFIAACERGPITTVASADSKVYEAFFAQNKQAPPDTLYFSDTTLVFDARASAGDAEPDRALLLGQLKNAEVPDELALSVSRRSAKKRPMNTLPLPQPAHILASGEIKGIFTRNPTDGWAEFYRRYPHAKRELNDPFGGYQAFSPIGYNGAGSEALFYSEHRCGPRCGSGQLVWVSRAPDGQWKVRKAIGLWIS